MECQRELFLGGGSNERFSSLAGNPKHDEQINISLNSGRKSPIKKLRIFLLKLRPAWCLICTEIAQHKSPLKGFSFKT